MVELLMPGSGVRVPHNPLTSVSEADLLLLKVARLGEYESPGRTLESLILRQNVGNPPEVTSDENSYAEIADLRTIPDVPINKG
jgi:hypothetical protein